MSSLFRPLCIIWTMEQPVVPQLFLDSNTNKSHEQEGDRSAEDITRQSCNTSYQMKTASKSRQKFMESEREERKLRRVLANRESARRTIRRRQEMSQELVRKAAMVLEVNEKLKKAKQLKLEEKNSLKDANRFLKAQLAKIKKTEPGEKQECPEKVLAEKAHSTPLKNQSPLMPCYWPTLFPSRDAYQFHHASSSHVMGSSQFHFPPTFINQGQDNPVGIIRPGTPIFVLPVPCLLPSFTQSSVILSQDAPLSGKHSFPDIQSRENNTRSLSNKKPREEASSIQRTVLSGCGSRQQGSLRHDQEQQAKNSEHMLAAAEARRRRREKVKLKIFNFSHSPRE